MDCDHIAKVLEWGFTEKHDFKVSKWGCTKCDITSDTPPKGKEEISIDHSNCKFDPCFGCKAKSLQLNAGDATRDIPDKKWKARLNEYKQARADGIQPAGTTPEKVRAAVQASEHLNKPYNAETMQAAETITKRSAPIIKEVEKL